MAELLHLRQAGATLARLAMGAGQQAMQLVSEQGDGPQAARGKGEALGEPADLDFDFDFDLDLDLDLDPVESNPARSTAAVTAFPCALRSAPTSTRR